MRILFTNDDGIHAPGLQEPGADRARALGRHLDRRARDRPERRRALALPQRSAAPARDLRAPLRREGHADRLRHHGRAPSSSRTTARTSSSPASTAARTSPRTSAIPARSPAPSRAPSSASPRSRCPRPTARAGATRSSGRAPKRHAAGGRAQDPGDRASPAARCVNVNFPDCAPDEVEGVATSVPGHAQPGAAAHRRARRRARQPLFLDRLRQARLHRRQRHRPLGDREPPHRRDAACAST